ncbi:MAG: hypothetical protein SFU86_19915 [Pirellulaceae bacterium]|nr:hypothetical protein [Pirellulaceae bacterium]
MLRNTWGGAAMLLLVLAGSLTRAAESRRKYEAGPLRAEDFAAEPPKSAGRAANTVTELRYEYRYRYSTGEKSVQIALESIEIHAYIRRDASWNRTPDDRALLDHEQGHADIAQIQCLQARRAFAEKIRRGFQVEAATRAEGIQALERVIQREMSSFEEAGRAADAEYDRATEHGLGGQQAEWRRVQRETLRNLQEEGEKPK